MKLWLDDVRRLPRLSYGIDMPDWVLAHSVNEGIALMKTGEVTFASLDHDLGIYHGDGGNGIKLLDWMAENNIWPTDGISVHSANPVGVRQMIALIDRYAPYHGDYYDAEYFNNDNFLGIKIAYTSRRKESD